MAEAGTQRVPVFISSTFRDMDHERDLINTLVIPMVNQRVADTGTSVYPIDLRWGIDTTDLASVEGRQQAVLDTCIDEVERCRPLFVGLLGARYGSIPPVELQQRARQRLGIDDPGFPLSVLAIEMIAACTSAVADGFSPIVVRRERPLGPSDGDGDRHRLDQLEAYLRSEGVDPLPYEPLDADASGPASDSTLVRTLVDRIEAACRRLPAAEVDATNWLDTELKAQEAHRRRLSSAFVGRRDEIETIRRFCDPMNLDGMLDGVVGDDIRNPVGRLRWERSPRRLSVLGPSGAGKSALAARAVDVLREEGSDAPLGSPQVSFVSAGVTAASDRLAVCLLVLLAQLSAGTANELADRLGPDEIDLQDVLGPWLAAFDGGASRRVAVIDGVDRLRAEPDQSITLSWLPPTLQFQNRIIVTAAEETLSYVVLRTHTGGRVLDLGELSAEDAVELIRGRVEAHHRALPDGVEELLVDRSCLARWLVVATDLLLTLSSYDYETVERAVAEGIDPERAVAELVRSVARGLPTALEGLHQEAFERLTEVLGEKVMVVLMLVGATLNGLRESDLLAICAHLDQELSESDLAVMRSTLGEHVTVHRERWTFVHASSYEAMATIVDEVADEIGSEVTTGLFAVIAFHLSSLPLDDPVRRSELLGALFRAPLPAHLARMLHDPALTSLPELRLFASVLALASAAGGDLDERLLEIVTEAETPDMQLTAASFIGESFLALLPPERARSLVAALRRVLAGIPAEAVSRFGQTAASISTFLELSFLDPFNPLDDNVESPGAALLQWERALKDGSADLSDAPRYLEHANDVFQLRQAVMLEFSVISVYAQAMLFEGRATTDRAGHILARHRTVCDALEHCEVDDPVQRAVFDLSRLAAARFLAVTWPDADVDVDDGDLELACRLADGLDASSIVVSCYAQIARGHALPTLAALDDGAVSTADAYECSVMLDRVLDRLAVERTMLPDLLLIENEWLVTTSLQVVLLESCGQIASACGRSLAMTGHPIAPEIFGWEQFSLLAFGGLTFWLNARTNDDPTPVIANLAENYDEHGPPGWSVADDEMPWAMVEMLMLLVALQWWMRTGDEPSSAFALAALDRALRVEDQGIVVPDISDAATPTEVAHEMLMEAESDLAQAVIEEMEDGERLAVVDLFDDDDVVRIVLLIQTAALINKVLDEHGRPSHPGPFSAAFWTALDAFVRQDDQQGLAAMEHVGTATDSAPDFDSLEEHDQRLFVATLALLDLHQE